MNKKDIEELFERLFPICRSITGDGLRKSLDIIGEHIELFRYEVPSGTKVFDWVVPDEWNIKGAYIKKNEEKVVDFKENNLHVMSYSEPVDKVVGWEELEKHLHVGESSHFYDRGVPYRTSYYKRDWAFCVSYKQYEKLKEDNFASLYKVKIDSTLKPGYLSYGVTKLEGESDKNFLFSSYLCHPSMANNELSGPILMMLLYDYLSHRNNKINYHFYLGPETIGALCYLQKALCYLQNRIDSFKNYLVGGLVLTQCADRRQPLSYKETKRDSYVNKMMEYLSKREYGNMLRRLPFKSTGSDERQWNSPNVNIPVGVFGRDVYCENQEYHTSADNLQFVDVDRLLECFELLKDFIFILENDTTYRTDIVGEPFYSKYELMSDSSTDEYKEILGYVFQGSNGKESLLDIAINCPHNFRGIAATAKVMKEKGIIY